MVAAGAAGALAVSALRESHVDAPGGPLTIFETADAERDLDDAIARGGPAPYGRVLWSSAPVVARVIAGMPLAGKRVLEIGCGTGLVSLVAARHGARVIATDIDAGALALLRRAADHAGFTVDTALFDVAGVEPLPQADVVVVADLLYEAELADAAARRALEAKRAGAVVVVGDPGRVFRPRFARLLEEGGVIARFEGGDVGVAVL